MIARLPELEGHARWCPAAVANTRGRCNGCGAKMLWSADEELALERGQATAPRPRPAVPTAEPEPRPAADPRIIAHAWVSRADSNGYVSMSTAPGRQVQFRGGYVPIREAIDVVPLLRTANVRLEFTEAHLDWVADYLARAGDIRAEVVVPAGYRLERAEDDSWRVLKHEPLAADPTAAVEDGLQARIGASAATWVPPAEVQTASPRRANRHRAGCECKFCRPRASSNPSVEAKR